jgi:DNA-directed RNA polymerase specialized sigma24 family protein
MKKAYGYSHKEIAAQLGISTSTVEKHVAAGLKRCSEYMQKKMNTNECAATPITIEETL